MLTSGDTWNPIYGFRIPVAVPPTKTIELTHSRFSLFVVLLREALGGCVRKARWLTLKTYLPNTTILYFLKYKTLNFKHFRPSLLTLPRSDWVPPTTAQQKAWVSYGFGCSTSNSYTDTILWGWWSRSAPKIYSKTQQCCHRSNHRGVIWCYIHARCQHH